MIPPSKCIVGALLSSGVMMGAHSATTREAKNSDVKSDRDGHFHAGQTTGFGAAAPGGGYGAPSGGYGAPSGGYGTPIVGGGGGGTAPGVGAPAGGYGAPSGGYGAPGGGYGAPVGGGGGGGVGGGIGGTGYGSQPTSVVIEEEVPGGLDFISLLIPLLALLGLALLFPTFLTIVGRRKRSVPDGEYESNPMTDALDRVNDIYGAVVQSEECMQRIACELGGLADDFGMKETPLAKMAQPFVPGKYKEYYHQFQSGKNCQKIKCGSLF